MSEPRIGVYPGTFDPLTNGHVDIICRATRVVDRLVVAVARNAGKEPLFPLAERMAMLAEEVESMTNGDGTAIEVQPFDSLLVEFARSAGAGIIIRGLRAVSDFEYEFQMAGMNARLDPHVETVFLMASDRHQFISSKLVREIGALGGDVAPFVPSRVSARLAARLGTTVDAPDKAADAGS